MNQLNAIYIEYIAMGKYGAFVWSSVFICLALLIGVFIYSIKRYKRMHRMAKNIGIKEIF